MWANWKTPFDTFKASKQRRRLKVNKQIPEQDGKNGSMKMEKNPVAVSAAKETCSLTQEAE